MGGSPRLVLWEVRCHAMVLTLPGLFCGETGITPRVAPLGLFCGEPTTTPRVLPQACSVGSQVSRHDALTGLCRDHTEKSPVSNASTTLSYVGSLLRNGAVASVIPRYRKRETPRQGDETTLSGKCLLNKCKDLSSIPGTYTKTLGRWQACVIPVLGRGKLEDSLGLTSQSG